MNDPGWEKLADAIDLKFGIRDHGRSTLPLEDNPDLTQLVTFITFAKDGQIYKLERVSRPAIVDRKSFHGRAASAGVRFENVYDPDSLTHKNNLYRQVGDDWELIEAGQLGL